MNKGRLVLVLGLLLGFAGFAGFYYFGTTSCRDMMHVSQPELAWLRHEFKLSDAEFTRVTALHEAYLPQCAERCRAIDQQNQRLKTLLDGSSTITPEIRNLLEARARTRAQCEAEMLKHFQEVSRAMPEEQGRRYLAWVQQQTVLRAQAMEARHTAQSGHHHDTQEPHH